MFGLDCVGEFPGIVVEGMILPGSDVGIGEFDIDLSGPFHEK